MHIKLLFFAQLREVFGENERDLDVKALSTVADILPEISSASKVDWDSVRFAVNEEFEGIQKILKDGDVLALLPPVSGG